MPSIVHWLLPKEDKFFDMLKEQSSNMVDAARELKKFIEEYDGLSQDSKKEFVKKLKDIESKGDDIAHKIIGLLDKTFITPIDKEDIHRLAMLLDDVVDLVYAASIRLVIFDVKRIDGFIKSLSDIVLEIANKIDEGVGKVGKLNGMGQFYVDTHTLENSADDIYFDAISELFKKDNPIDIIKYKEIYEFLEAITDRCEGIANVIESVVVKHA